MMKTYLLARFDLTLYALDESLDLKPNEIAVFEKESDFELLVKSKNKNFDSYNLNVKSKCDYVTMYDLNSGSRLVELKPKYIFSPFNVKKKIINFEGQIFLIEILSNNLIQIYAEQESYLLCKNDFIDYSVEIKTCRDDLLFLCFKYKEGDYFYIFTKNNLLYQGLTKEINIKDNHLIVLKDDFSCYGQKRVIDFDLKEDTVKSYFVYSDEREICEDIGVLYLFLDAVKIKNHQLCKKYLSQELCELDESGLFEFFEEFDEYEFIDNACVLEKNNEVVKIVHFEVRNNQIVNIFD